MFKKTLYSNKFENIQNQQVTRKIYLINLPKLGQEAINNKSNLQVGV